MARMPRALLSLILVFIPLSIAAAGHDVSTVRYVPATATGDSAVAFSNNHFLTIWPMSVHVYGTLTDPATANSGDVFPVLPFGAPDKLQLAATETGFIALWSDTDGAWLGDLNAQGALENRYHLDIDRLRQPRMAFNGTHVVILDRTSDFPDAQTAIRVSAFDRRGVLVNRTALPLPYSNSYAVANAGDDFAVGTAGQSGVRLFRLGSRGDVVSETVIGEPPSVAHLPALEVALAWTKERTVIAWAYTGTGFATSVTSDGSVASLAEFPATGMAFDSGLGVLNVDSGFVLLWTVYSGSYSTNATTVAARLDKGAALLDHQAMRVGPGRFRSGASAGATIDVALGNSLFGSPVTTVIASVDSSGVAIRSLDSHTGIAVRQLSPSVTSDGLDFVVTWGEFASTSYRTMIGRVTRDGRALDGAGIDLADGAFRSPIVRGPASQSLAVWTTDLGVFATRWTTGVGKIDVTPIKIADANRPPDVTALWNGSHYFVVWSSGTQLLGSFVGVDGSVTPPRSFVTLPQNDGNSITRAELAWDGHQYLVAFSLTFSGGVLCTCLQPLPNEVRLVRVGPDGNAIDATPVVVPGTHLGAHVASSGSEFLVVLDGYNDLSTIVVREDPFITPLSIEVPLFHWYSALFGDVVWDGSAYVIGWRYGAPTSFWLAAARVNRLGQAETMSFANAGRPWWSSNYPTDGPSLAVNDVGQTALAVSEAAPPSDDARARIYFTSELDPMPLPPPAPRNAVSYFSGTTARIDWQSDGAPGFILERSGDFGKTWSTATAPLPSDARTTTVYASVGNQFRIRALGPGGMSAGAITSIGSQQRRHASR